MTADRPNFVLISADNLGYGDWGCFGSTVHRTPHTDRLAAEGMRLTHFYSSSPVCTPSRASLMTGCYPRRLNLHVGGFDAAVLKPLDPKGLHPDETTVARLLRDAGYATGCIGKWHLGDQPPFLPTRHGFDHYFGIPYSDDMRPRPENPVWPPLPLMNDETVVEAGMDRDLLTRRYTNAAVAFIREHADQPFFLYLAHAMPGSTDRPFASPAMQGRSANGPYGDSVEEMDWSTGKIMAALRAAGLDEQTVVMTTSDHGPIPNDPPQGSAGPLRGPGYSTAERGMRPPCIVRWPGRIPAGTECTEVMSVMDVLPTFAALAGAALPDRVIDGHDIGPFWFGVAAAASPYDACGLFYYQMGQLQAVRSGRFKLCLPLAEKIVTVEPRLVEARDTELYDLVDDPGETTNIAESHPDTVVRLLALADGARAELGDTDRQGAGQRPAGWVENPRPCRQRRIDR